MLGLRHIEHWPRNSNAITFTFDDAPHPLTTPMLLASLKSIGVKATFFVVGDGIRFYPELASRIAREGHHMANHSQYHINLTHVAPADYDHQVLSCFNAMRDAYLSAGLVPPKVHLFRPPGGGLNRQIMSYLYKHNITLAWWSNNVGDWTRPPAWKIAAGVKANLHPGDICLLHDAGIGTAQALPNIAQEARARGLHFAPMPDPQH